MYIYIHKPHFILRVYHISVYMFCVSYLCAQALHNYLLFILRVYPISVCMFCVSYLSVQALHNYLLFNSVSHFCVYVLCVLFVYKLCTTLLFFVCRNSHGEMETTRCSTTLTQIPFLTVTRKRITSCTVVSTEQQTSLDHFMPRLFPSCGLV